MSRFALLIGAWTSSRRFLGAVPLEADVIVIGAGYAGLSAARDLQAAGINVLVFEASSRPGGRTLNYDLSKLGVADGYVELGGQYLDERKYQPDAWALIKDELGFEILPAAQPGSAIFFTSQGPSTRPLAAFGVLAGLEVGFVIEELTRQKWLLPLNKDWLDSISFEEWFAHESVNGTAKALMRSLAALGVGNAEPSDMSALDAVKTFGGLLDGNGLIHAATSAESHVVKGGLAAPTLVMANGLGAALKLSSPVLSVFQDDKAALVKVQLGSGTTVDVRSQHVLFSGTPFTTLNVSWTPPLPQNKQRLFEQLQTGNCMKATLVYNRPFWQEQNLSGQILNVADLDHHPFACEGSKLSGSELGVIVCFAGGNFVKEFSSMSFQHRRDNIAKFVSSSFGERALNPIHYIDHDWAAEPYIRGAFASAWKPGVETHWGASLNTDFGRVSWIGADVVGHGGRWGYVSSAIMSGREAAKKLINELASYRRSPSFV